MAKDPGILNIELMFRALKSNNLPEINSLATTLNKVVAGHTSGSLVINNNTVAKFATASVEAWQRALHSFLMSASMTETSPIWSSVAGYYSSHYTMRAFSHLFGYFQLFREKVIVKLDLTNTPYHVVINKKQGQDREHSTYWKLVHTSQYFKDDPFFTKNEDTPPPVGTLKDFISDGGHRNRANYADHVYRFPVFKPLDDETLRRRIFKLSSIEINDPPIPNVNRFPDLDSVQLIAYHRILKYRAFLDEILSTTKGFWAQHRNPTWRPKYLDFQATSVDYSAFVKDFF